MPDTFDKEQERLDSEIRDSLNETFCEMIRAFLPFRPGIDSEDEVILKTTDEIVNMVEPMLTIGRREVVHLLNRSGYKIRYVANGWAWMMKLRG